ncbi:unnamed protein product [Angiostrongylus costaricensis]|uniref:DZF domain-containing protein n=1 Tax=Angiostrongylus costaricensis TaxID=334426 RepID=A0A0R3PDH6_ANGCS|nr:unnamed protein product [Angiostrongylus costaricensis]
MTRHGCQTEGETRTSDAGKSDEGFWVQAQDEIVVVTACDAERTANDLIYALEESALATATVSGKPVGGAVSGCDAQPWRDDDTSYTSLGTANLSS